MKKYLLVLTAAVFLLSGCENNNIYSWSHAEGGDSSVEALLADGQKAESDGDYDKALDYYNKILASDADNSEALYGKASSELKNAGLDISDLVSKAIGGDTAGAESLLGSLDFAKLLAGSEKAKDALAKIADGKADGTIPADNPDVNLNLAIVRVVYSASYLKEKYSIDVNENFKLSNTNIDPDDNKKIIGELEAAINNLEVTGMDTTDIKANLNTFKSELEK